MSFTLLNGVARRKCVFLVCVESVPARAGFQRKQNDDDSLSCCFFFLLYSFFLYVCSDHYTSITLSWRKSVRFVMVNLSPQYIRTANVDLGGGFGGDQIITKTTRHNSSSVLHHPLLVRKVSSNLDDAEFWIYFCFIGHDDEFHLAIFLYREWVINRNLSPGALYRQTRLYLWTQHTVPVVIVYESGKWGRKFLIRDGFLSWFLLEKAFQTC